VSLRERSLLLALIGALAWAVPAGAEPGSERLLRFNPFLRPDLGAAGRGPDQPRAADAEWRPVLTATLVAGERSLANLGGVVLGLGEETHGYRLVEVREFEAVFENAGEQVVLPVEAHRSGAL
jgi:hypothetical protein